MNISAVPLQELTEITEILEKNCLRHTEGFYLSPSTAYLLQADYPDLYCSPH